MNKTFRIRFGTSKGSWNLFFPFEVMRFLPTGGCLAAGANFYIPEIAGRQIKIEEES
jgi:hypothetical protein